MATDLAVVIIYSISHYQLVHALLMRCHTVGGRGMSSATGGLDIVVLCAIYSVAIRLSSCVRWCENCWKWCCDLDCLRAMSSSPYIVVCTRTSLGRMPSIFGANHGGELLLGSFGYVFIKGIFDTQR